MSASEQALQRLLEGNRRFMANRPAIDKSSRRTELVQGQKPFVIIFSCVDSRVPPELIFDQGLGDLFVVRTAGEVLDRAVLGSLQFGVAVLDIPVIVVLGHEYCGAVQSAVGMLGRREKAEGDMEYLVNALKPAVEQGQRLGGDLWEQAGRAQVALQVEKLKRSPILAQAVERGTLMVVGAWYSLSTGLVEMNEEERP